MIAALNSYVIGFDNLSFIPDWLSDALCSISTGAGFRTRALFTDTTEVLFKAERPIVVNAIADIARRGDLLDRALMISLDPIEDTNRRTERAIDAAFREIQPLILAALADAVVQALRTPVVLTTKPRMADFAELIESAAPALGWEAKAFLSAYTDRRDVAVDVLLDGDLVAVALDALRKQEELRQATCWSGPTADLRAELVELTAKGDQKSLPKSPRALAGALRRLLPGLRSRGVIVALPMQERSGELRGKRIVTITWSAEPEVKPAEPEVGTVGTHGTSDCPF